MLSRLARFLPGIRTRLTSSRVIYSFIVDEHPKFAYQAYHLAMSILNNCQANPYNIHIQFTPNVSRDVRNIFSSHGFKIHELNPFGDDRYCNKIAQIDNLIGYDVDIMVLLDTDTIFVSDPAPLLLADKLQAKVVDVPNPSKKALETIADRAGMTRLPPLVETDAAKGETYLGNCNGGFYAIPRPLAQTVSEQWKKWALWLLDNIEPLSAERKSQHVDQVAMWLSIHMGNIPFSQAPSNLNYYIHFDGDHLYHNQDSPISLIHYHDRTMNAVGLIKPQHRLAGNAAVAVDKANHQIKENYNNKLFWSYRYGMHPDLGSGIGSRGSNLEYKRKLLLDESIESIDGILDIGCGDMAVLKPFKLQNYLGLDQSEYAINMARSARPDLEFRVLDMGRGIVHVPKKRMVLCFEVLIHQETREDYDRVLVTV